MVATLVYLGLSRLTEIDRYQQSPKLQTQVLDRPIQLVMLGSGGGHLFQRLQRAVGSREADPTLCLLCFVLRCLYSGVGKSAVTVRFCTDTFIEE